VCLLQLIVCNSVRSNSAYLNSAYFNKKALTGVKGPHSLDIKCLSDNLMARKMAIKAPFVGLNAVIYVKAH
jgi:hypothetical protein